MRSQEPPVTGRRPPWWLWLILGNSLLALPTAISPSSLLASVTYLLGLALLTGALFVATLSMPERDRRPWLLLSAVAATWLAGDVVQRILDALALSPTVGEIGPADVFWLASYPLEVLAIAALIGARRLPRQVVRDIHLDALTITVAPTLGAWLVLIQPNLGEGDSVVGVLGNSLYPLGDVTVFSLALTVLLVPGARGPATFALVTCIGATLPLDLLLHVLDQAAPGFNTGHVDAAYLFCNTLLGAAALHPSRSRLTAPAGDHAGQHLQMWRTSVLGISLLLVSLTNVFVPATGWQVVPGLIATVVIAVSIVIRFHRITRAQELTARELRRMAEHDQLTGVANRELLNQRLPDFVARTPGALVYIDLDGFKALNDRWGHHTGDAVLCVVTERLSRMMREDDLVARIGGDEFVILLNASNEHRARTVTSRLLDDLCAPMTVGPQTVQVGASIGVVVLDDPGDPAPWVEDVLRSADAAMYEAKRGGGGIRIVRYRREGSAEGREEFARRLVPRPAAATEPATAEEEAAVV